MTDESQIRQLLQAYQLPYLQQDLIAARAIKSISIEKTKIKLEVNLGFPADSVKPEILQGIRTALQALTDDYELEIQYSWKIKAHAVQTGVESLPRIKNIIAVGSGKGGVGKSTTAVNLAIALAQENIKVGLLDADIYGPNQPQMLGASGKPEVHEDKKLSPVRSYGLQTMSIGYLVDKNTPMIWRGPMVTAALQQLLRDTLWEDLDYLIIDLPPGTGDIQLTLAQKIPVSGAVIVTTPQEVALLDARKGIEMFRKVKVNVLGIIENMSSHACSHCGHQEALFGQEGGVELAKTYQLPLLGQLPLAKAIREGGDAGKPVVADPNQSALARSFRAIALTMAAQLSLQPVNQVVKFPKIVVE